MIRFVGRPPLTSLFRLAVAIVRVIVEKLCVSERCDYEGLMSPMVKGFRMPSATR
jgi:hypothetical protein